MVVMLLPSTGAGLDRHAIQHHHAGAALAGVAADLGSGKAQVFPQKMDQQGPRFDFGLPGLPVDVDLHRNLHYRHLL